MSKLFFILGFAILAVATARVVRRDAPTTEFSFDSFFENVQAGMKSLETTLLKTTGSSDSEEFKKKTDEFLGDMAKTWDAWVKDAEEKSKDLKDLPAVKEVEAAMNKVYENFKTDHPTAAEDVSKYMDKLKVEAEDVMTKIKELGEGEESQKVKEFSEHLLVTAQEQFNTMTNELKEKFKTH